MCICDVNTDGRGRLVAPLVCGSVDTMSREGAIIGAGIAMGFVHALTGPDHMSALVTVAVNERLQAFWLGVRWGIGHSTGLLIVTGSMLILRDSYGMDEHAMLEKTTGMLNWFVGFAMLAVGLWGYLKAYRLRQKPPSKTGTGHYDGTVLLSAAATAGGLGPQRRARTAQCCVGDFGAADTSPTKESGIELVDGVGGGSVDEFRGTCDSSDASNKQSGPVDAAAAAPEPATPATAPAEASVPAEAIAEASAAAPADASSLEAASATAAPGGCPARLQRLCRGQVKTLVALAIGTLHGIGGPGGVLSVLPSLAIPGALGSCLYLFSFCASSTLAMGGFAALYGECTHRSQRLSEKLPWILAIFSSSTSVLVGIVWIICSALGALDQFLETLGLE